MRSGKVGRQIVTIIRDNEYTEMVAEELGGSYQFVQSSAEDRTGISAAGTAIFDGNQFKCSGYLCKYCCIDRCNDRRIQKRYIYLSKPIANAHCTFGASTGNCHFHLFDFHVK